MKLSSWESKATVGLNLKKALLLKKAYVLRTSNFSLSFLLGHCVYHEFKFLYGRPLLRCSGRVLVMVCRNSDFKKRKDNILTGIRNVSKWHWVLARTGYMRQKKNVDFQCVQRLIFDVCLVYHTRKKSSYYSSMSNYSFGSNYCWR